MIILLIFNSPVTFPARKLSRNKHVEINNLIRTCLLVVAVTGQVVVAVVVAFPVVADLVPEDEVLMVAVMDLVPMDKVLITDTKEDI